MRRKRRSKGVMRDKLTNAIVSALTLILIFAFVVSCDDDDGECNFDFDDILNGSTRPSQTSEWDCVGDGEVFSVAFFEDQSGSDSDFGPFTWERSGCRSLVFFSGFGVGEIFDLQVSIDSGIFSFAQTIDGDFFDVACELDTTPEDTI